MSDAVDAKIGELIDLVEGSLGPWPVYPGQVVGYVNWHDGTFHHEEQDMDVRKAGYVNEALEEAIEHVLATYNTHQDKELVIKVILPKLVMGGKVEPGPNWR